MWQERKKLMKTDTDKYIIVDNGHTKEKLKDSYKAHNPVILACEQIKLFKNKKKCKQYRKGNNKFEPNDNLKNLTQKTKEHAEEAYESCESTKMPSTTTATLPVCQKCKDYAGVKYEN